MRTDKQGLIMYQWLWYFGCCISCFLKTTFVRIASFICCSHSEPDKSWCVKIIAPPTECLSRLDGLGGWIGEIATVQVDRSTFAKISYFVSVDQKAKDN